MIPTKAVLEHWAEDNDWLLMLAGGRSGKGTYAHYLTPAGFEVEVQFEGDEVKKIRNLSTEPQ